MYVCLVGGGARLATSDAERIVLWDVSGDAPTKIAEVAQPGQRPLFSQSPAGERMTAGAGLLARSYTPLDAKGHWTDAKSRIGIYRDTDLSEVAQITARERLDPQTLALSADGSLVASTSHGAGPVAFDVATGEERCRVVGSIGSGVSFSTAGDLLAAGSTGQDGGRFFLVRLDDAREVVKLPRPSSKAPLYDSPFRSAFASDDSFVAFTCAAWGAGGITLYDPRTTEERWAKKLTLAGDEEAEHWEAPELDLAFDDTRVLVGQDGRIDAFAAADGTPLSVLEHEPADASYFAADTGRRCVWVTRGGAPTRIDMPADW